MFQREGTFHLASEFMPCGDQPEAIRKLVRGVLDGRPAQTLLGVTGSGKTFTMANVVEQLNRPTLVLAPNKTLAAQLYGEFKDLFPGNAVEYFVSYYDYYQPEAYIPSSDSYIEKDASINDELDKLRLSATKSLIERNDVLVVASVSCIYGIGSPTDFHSLVVFLREGDRWNREAVLRQLLAIQYDRNDVDFHRGTFRVRGDVVDIFPAYEDRTAIRVEFFGDEIESLTEIDSLTGARLKRIKRAAIYPNSVYVTSRPTIDRALVTIREELSQRLVELTAQNKLVEHQRLKQRTEYDLELLREMGSCAGIENYSRHFSGRAPGEPPYVLLDYFPQDFLMIIDESHIAIPQIRAMYFGDRSRKETLVDYGFRLPSALDNRPLKFEEFEKRAHTLVFTSATPGDYELQRSEGLIVEQLIRPTGLIDPLIEVRPVGNQVQDLLEEIRTRLERRERVLVTTLTKRFAEDLAEYYTELGIKVRYLHSDVDVLERVQLIRELRLGKFDVLIGINLLREGLDIPEVSLVAILDADKEGYLRSAVSLIQTVGRAARHLDGMVLMYADRVTDSMQRCIEETNRRREVQETFNREHGVIPRSVTRQVSAALDYSDEPPGAGGDALLAAEDGPAYSSVRQVDEKIEDVTARMKAAAAALEFERAAALRDELSRLRSLRLKL